MISRRIGWRTGPAAAAIKRGALAALLVIAMVTTEAVAGPAPRPAAERLDRWHVIRLGGEQAGWMHETVTRRDEVLTSASDMKITIRRGEAPVEVRFHTEFRETTDGEPISMLVRQHMGSTPVETRYEFVGGEVEVTTDQAGRQRVERRPRPEGRWLPPAAAAEFLAQRLEAGAEQITVRTIDPLAGLDPVTVVRRNFEPTTLEVQGKTVPAIRCEATQSSTPSITTVEYLGRDGRPIRTETRIGSMRAVVVAADRELAQAQVSPPELMQRTFVKPGGAIEDPRRIRRAEYRLSMAGDPLPPLPSGGAQRVERIDASTARVVVDLDASDGAEGAERAPLLASTRMLDAEDARVRALMEHATRGARGARSAARAETMRRFVHRHVREKSLGVGFATASEVARTREGDCTEHAVLLAAMLRADGIPARVASGLVFVDSFAGRENIFGYHMWTQALVEDESGQPRWLDLDATLPPRTPFDASHITLSTSTLEEGGSSNALIALVPLLGRLEIEIVSAE